VCAEIEPLLMMRPPLGVCAFMILMASWVQTNMPVKLVSTTFFQVSSGNSSIGTAGAPMPALLNRQVESAEFLASRGRTGALIDSGSLTSVGTEMVLALPASFAVSSSLSARRPASTTA
jgi:hypothetical protein